MKFEVFLLRNHWLKKSEHRAIAWRCIKSNNGHTNGSDFLEPKIDAVTFPGQVREFPFGDVLSSPECAETLREVLARSNAKDLSELVDRWQKWHVDNLEPISEYALHGGFGRRLHMNGDEKKHCAQFIADSRAYGRSKPLVHTSDHLIIPEGTSTFFVGLAVAARLQNIWYITSNGAFVRELNENPLLWNSAENISVIGGELDPYNHNGGASTRGFLGKETERYFELAIKDKPGATVVICSVNGFLPGAGPFAPTPKAASTRFSLLNTAFENNIREIVFVLDYTKMLASKQSTYGDPIYAQGTKWQKVFSEYRDLISIVVAPPPELEQDAELCALAPADRPTHGLQGPMSNKLCQEYLAMAKEFDLISRGNGFESRFYEVGGHTRRASPVMA